MKLDKFLKILWLINGIGLLIILLIAAFVAISEIDYISGWTGHDSYAYTDQSHEGTSRKLTYQEPEPIYGTENFLLVINAENYDLNSGSSSYSDSYFSDERYYSCVNVIFLNTELRPVKTLLDTKAFINQFKFPSGNLYNMSDTTAKHIVYLIATQDTNQDGNIDFSDDTDLFISDLSGNDLHQITNDMVISDYVFIQKGQKLRIDYLNKNDVESTKHFALYHIAERKLEKLSGIDESLNAIQTLYKP
ncbi:MAG TPA: hypothetical protein VGK59_02555 [Ohtaekwangia sp.]